ncbi:uncharacterized protein V6R79_009677 [Siganus canaliculatus]
MIKYTCNIPMHHYLYMNQAYKEEIKKIEASGGKIKAEVKLTFEAGNPNCASSEFFNLVQKSSLESGSFTVPLKKLNAEELTDALKIVQRPENRVLLTLSSEEMTVCGPQPSQDAIRASLKAAKKTSVNPCTSLTTDMRMTGQMYQKTAKPGNSWFVKAAPTYTVGGATAGDNKDDTCPVCLDLFTNKKQLKCKHEFCQECLKLSEKALGPTCPVCKDVYGMIEGDQPDGYMSWKSDSYSLPGFLNCGTIVINYHIPSGRQTKKHPSPGRFYSGIQRTAFLPDNQEGNEVVRLLKKAFDQKLIFTVGTSRTTGMDNQVIWNDIHHKTSMTGGPLSFGYPDPDYLSRVKEELKAKGIV